MAGSIALGAKAPDFILKDLQGVQYRLSDQRVRTVVLDFWSAECPWSRQSDEALSKDQVLRELVGSFDIWRIASNANESRETLVRVAAERGVEPVLYDPDQEVANLFGAQTTPHIFVIDGKGRLRYMGALDDSTWREPEPSRSYLAEAVQALELGRDPELDATPARGCSIVRHQLE